MTKKISILSIVVVLLLSVCLVGCGDSSVAENDYKKMIKGTWIIESADITGGLEKQSNNDYTFEFSDNTLRMNDPWKLEGNESLYYEIKESNIYYGKTANKLNKQMRIIKLTKDSLELELMSYETRITFYFKKG